MSSKLAVVGLACLLLGCGVPPKEDAVVIAKPENIVWQGSIRDYPEVLSQWQAAESCTGLIRAEPMLIISNDFLDCNGTLVMGCADRNTNTIYLMLNSWLYMGTGYHESLHILLQSGDENLIALYMTQCKF